jgi:hypothetical protein
VGNFVGGLWDFISDPAGQLTKGGVSFFKAVNEGMTKTTTINFNQAAFIEQYAVTMGIGTLVILAVMLYIQSARPTREKALAYPSLLTAFFSMIAVPAGFYLFNRLIDELVAPYTASGQAAFNGLFTRMETLTTNLRDFGPANNLIASVSIAALYLAVAAILWVELILRGSIIYALLMFYPVLAAGWLTPSQRNGMVPALRSLIHNYLNTAAGIFLTKWVIAVMLATAGALSGGDASARLSALGLVILTVLAPFAVMAFIPVVSGSAAHGISRSFRAAAARTGRSTARRLRTP